MRRSRSPTKKILASVREQLRAHYTYQDKLVIFSYAAEAIRSTITAYLIKRDAGDERGMSLTPGDYPLLPRREYRNKVVLAPRLRYSCHEVRTERRVGRTH